MRRLGFALAALAAAASGAPEGEILREEGYNYLVAGKLPPGWTPRKTIGAFVYEIDGIPHAHAHLHRERVDGAVEPRRALEQRAEHYRFPGAAEPFTEEYGTATWGGREAATYVHTARVGDVACRREVTALFASGVWYELVVTVYGEATAADAGFANGRGVFRDGFRLLSEAVPEDERADAAERKYADAAAGYALTKPAGFVRVEVDPRKDPGCRLAFERMGPHGKQRVRVRLFEYGKLRGFDPAKWFPPFFGSFASSHEHPQRATVAAPPAIAGAKRVVGEDWSGAREGHPIRTRMLLIEAGSGRIFGLRLRRRGEPDDALEQSLAALVASLRVE